MKLTHRVTAWILTLVILFSALATTASAKKFAKEINTNIGITTQYAYEENDPSWIRQLVIKENMMSVDGIVNEKPIHPVTDYPYTTDAPNFQEEVNEYVILYTLDENSQKAAYIYVFQQLGALSIIADPDATDKSKAQWLRDNGIVVTEEDESDPDAILMISALYALMKNDFYYVFTGERLTIPPGTTLEAALMMYLIALDGDDKSLLQFLNKYFNITSIVSLEDYIYYTTLFALYTNGYVSSRDFTTIERDEVFRRMAIMTIENAGLAVDVNTATTEEIQVKYMAAMLGTQYKVTLDPDSVLRANRNNTVPFYIIQRMANEDKNLAISANKYTYEEAFDIVLKKTNRFDLEKQFYSDIFEYNVYLDAYRDIIYLNPTPLTTAGITVKINGKAVQHSHYETLKLNSDEKQVFTVSATCKGGHTSTYKINIFQGLGEPDNSKDVTGIVSNFAVDVTDALSPTVTPTYDYLDPNISLNNGIVPPAPNPEILHINEYGQLVDSKGNVISNSVSESLPAGYGYILDTAGNITIGKLDEVTTTATEVTEDNSMSTEQIKTIVIYFSALLLVVASVAGVIYYRMAMKRRKTKTTNKTTKTKKASKKK
ncbi:MAG: cadherin-like beta sandwich domain-containing protein [Clostridia bacterium]|nr:cadherin-like beta sandwich domain-containing protein [Clostridia bacterium]